jgi:HEPN domain-containing protein
MAQDDFETMLFMFESKRYSWTLFIGHLVIEKLLKALFIKTHDENTPVPKIHNLLTLARRCVLTLTEEQEDKLQVITEFNIHARYQDYKLDFYKKCSPSFSEHWKKEIEDLRQWILKQI